MLHKKQTDLSCRYLIIGAGPTGLGAAYRLSELGANDFLVIDQSDHVGGLAASFKDDAGFTWDVGGHVQFSHYSYFDDLMNKALGKNGWFFHQREAWAWMFNRFVPYPVQNNIRYFPQEIMWECLRGIIDANLDTTSSKQPENFEKWIYSVFGKGLAKYFMLPYNFKVWAYPPKEMSYQWIGERVAVTDLRRVTENLLFERDDISWGPNNSFQFPKKGGTGGIWESVARLIGEDKFLLSNQVKQINLPDRFCVLSDGKKIKYKALLSTMPLDKLYGMLLGLKRKDLVEKSSHLKYSSSNIIGIGLEGKPAKKLKTKCWMYFPEDNNPFYRVTVFSNYSKNNVPDPKKHWSLMTEVSESDAKPVSQKNLINEVIEGLHNTKLITKKDKIVSVWSHREAYGYPTPSLDRDEILRETIPFIERFDVYSRGRFGGWKYEVSNQDHSLMQGVEWANRIILGVPETTLIFPSVANANWGRV